MLAYRVREHNKINATREVRATKKKKKDAYYVPGIKYVLAESSRWLLHRRRGTKKMNIPDAGIKRKKRKKRKTKNEK